jgi:uncharacterized membrane protein
MVRRQAIALLALAGFFIALYLWLHKIGFIGQLACGTGGCEVVQTSRYAELFGLPVALYGVIGYAALFTVSLVATSPANLARRAPDVMLAALATAGFAFTAYLTAVELFVIHAVCRWCAGSAAVISAIWVLTIMGIWRRS